MQSYRLLIVLLLAALTSFPVAADEADDDKLFYYLGIAIDRSLQGLDLTEKEQGLVLEGLTASMSGEAEQLDDNVYGPKIQQLGRERAALAAERELTASREYLADVAAQPGAQQLESGVVYKELQPGSGAQPSPTSQVKAHYHGTLRDGTVFDSSRDRGEPLTIGLNQVIPCWTDGIALMKAGGKAVLTCPSATAYGPNGQGIIPGNAALNFEVELLEVLSDPLP